MASLNYTAMQLALRAKLATLSAATSTAFARASTATYTDANGLVQTAAINVIRNAHYVGGLLQSPLIETADTNVLLRSQEIDNVYWTKNGTTITANNTTAPDGTATADKLVEDGSGPGNHRFFRDILCGPGVETYSVWVKAGERTKCVVSISDNVTGGPSVGVDLSNGTTFATGMGVGTWTGITSVVTAYASGWYRVSVSGTKVDTIAGQSTPTLNIWTTATSYAGDNASGIYVWGADFKLGALSSYIATTTVTVTRAADIDIMLSATATGYARVTGSFLTDGFTAGQEITPVGFATNVPDTIQSLTATTITTLNPKTVETAVAGRSLSVLTFSFATENVKFTPVTGRPYIEEQFVGGPTSLNSLGALGNVTAEPMYVLNVYTASNEGFLGGSRYVDSIMALFAPSTAMTLSTGDTLFVRADTGPYRGQVQQVDGWACISVKIPLRVYTNNTI